MNFALLPPEINSARMYVGPGSGPMLAAAASWDELAADLYSKASSFGAVTSGLTSGPWLGPAAASMSAAVAPYVSWMTTVAAQAEQTAAQAKSAAVAYEAAFAMTVPPPVIAANRSMLMALVATNFLGQNTPAIMATEAHYMQMWAQDAAAMVGYAAHSASASTLTPFHPPAPATNPAGLAGQAAAMAQAAGTGAGSSAQNVMSVGPQVISAVPQALQGLASSTSSTSSLSGLLSLATGSSSSFSLTSVPSYISPFTSMGSMSTSATSATMSANSIAANGRSATLAQETVAREGAQGIIRGSAPGQVGGISPVGLNGGGTAASASLGQAKAIGALSVPQGWATSAPQPIRLVVSSSPATSASAAPQAWTGTGGTTFGQLASAGMVGRALAGSTTLSRRQGAGAVLGQPVEPDQQSLGGRVAGIAAELRELAGLHDQGILTDEEFAEEKRHLLNH